MLLANAPYFDTTIWASGPDCWAPIPAASAQGFIGTFSPEALYAPGIIDAVSTVALTFNTIGTAGSAGVVCVGTCRTITSGQVPGPGTVVNWIGSWITALSDADDAVGAERYSSSTLNGQVTYPTFWPSNGVRQHLSESVFGSATAINATDQIVGATDQIVGVDPSHRAFIWQAGTMTDLGSLGGASAIALGINDAGQVVGASKLANGSTHGFLWQAGSMTDLGTLGGTASSAEAINNVGQVVGTSLTTAGALHAFVWQAGTMTDLGTLGGSTAALSRPPNNALTTQPIDQPVAATLGLGPGGWLPNKHVINDAGQVVGRSTTATGESHAFLWQSGTMRDLGTIGKTSAAIAINASGQVAIDEGGVVLFDPATCPLSVQ